MVLYNELQKVTHQRQELLHGAIVLEALRCMKNLISLISLTVFFSTGTASATETLYFRRVVDDKKIYDQHPQNFEVVVFKDRRGSYENYIERKPSFEIDTAEIKSVTIDKTSVRGNDKGSSYKAT